MQPVIQSSWGTDVERAHQQAAFLHHLRSRSALQPIALPAATCSAQLGSLRSPAVLATQCGRRQARCCSSRSLPCLCIATLALFLRRAGHSQNARQRVWRATAEATDCTDNYRPSRLTNVQLHPHKHVGFSKVSLIVLLPHCTHAAAGPEARPEARPVARPVGPPPPPSDTGAATASAHQHCTITSRDSHQAGHPAMAPSSHAAVCES